MEFKVCLPILAVNLTTQVLMGNTTVTYCCFSVPTFSSNASIFTDGCKLHYFLYINQYTPCVSVSVTSQRYGCFICICKGICIPAEKENLRIHNLKTMKYRFRCHDLESKPEIDQYHVTVKTINITFFQYGPYALTF